MDPILNDKRFAKLATDKKFRSVGKKHKKVEIDKRFGALFTDKNFVSKCSVDKRGRPKQLSAKESYEKFYQLEESSSDEEDDDDKNDESENDKDSFKKDVNDLEDEDEEIEEDIKSKLLSSDVDYARGEANLYSDSSSEEGSDDEENDANDVAGEEDDEGEVEYFDKWGELDAEAERTEEATARLAVCNMDWDRVGAEDIFLLLSSFCPAGAPGVTGVHVYISDFGKERLEEEQTLGPAELRRLKGEDLEDDSDDDELLVDNKKAAAESAAAMERVRQYQVNRLKYYYAVATFDSVGTASAVYDECDGMEYELSATRIDLRFIPADMEFSEPVSSCLTAPDPAKYQPKLFTTTALQQGKVELTWDEENQDKMKAMKEAFSRVDDDDYGNMSHLIGSASESEEEAEVDSNEEKEEGDERNTIDKYRALLAGITNKETRDEAGNMEVTWNDEDVTEEAQEELTPWEKYLEKKKSKRKKKGKEDEKHETEDDIPDDVDLNDPFFAEELGEDYVKQKKDSGKKKKKPKKNDDNDNVEASKDLNLMVMDSDDEKEHFDFKHIVEAESKGGKSIKKKWKNKKKQKELEVPTGDSFSVDVGDNRFAAMFNQAEFNIDPTNPSFKKTKNMEKIIVEKQKRITSGLSVKERDSINIKKQKLDPELSQALKSVKNKWKKNAVKSKKSKLKFKVRDN